MHCEHCGGLMRREPAICVCLFCGRVAVVSDADIFARLLQLVIDRERRPRSVEAPLAAANRRGLGSRLGPSLMHPPVAMPRDDGCRGPTASIRPCLLCREPSTNRGNDEIDQRGLVQSSEIQFAGADEFERPHDAPQSGMVQYSQPLPQRVLTLYIKDRERIQHRFVQILQFGFVQVLRFGVQILQFGLNCFERGSGDFFGGGWRGWLAVRGQLIRKLGSDRPVKGTFQVDGTQPARPVLQMGQLGLRRFARRTEDGRAVIRLKLKPAFPDAVLTLATTRTDRVGNTLRTKGLAERTENQRHCQLSLQGSCLCKVAADKHCKVAAGKANTDLALHHTCVVRAAGAMTPWNRAASARCSLTSLSADQALPAQLADMAEAAMAWVSAHATITNRRRCVGPRMDLTTPEWRGNC
jgi:hypothetical protein